MNVAKNIMRIIRLLDWLNTGIDQRREKYILKKFFQSYNAKNLFRELQKEIMKIFYAVFVLYFNFRGNKSSVVSISNMLMAVVATSLKAKVKKLPKDIHSSRSKYP
jgi:hypothetical protein